MEAGRGRHRTANPEKNRSSKTHITPFHKNSLISTSIALHWKQPVGTTLSRRSSTAIFRKHRSEEAAISWPTGTSSTTPAFPARHHFQQGPSYLAEIIQLPSIHYPLASWLLQSDGRSHPQRPEHLPKGTSQHFRQVALMEVTSNKSVWSTLEKEKTPKCHEFHDYSRKHLQCGQMSV